MELNNDIGTGQMLKQALPHMQIDPKKARFPCCIVWTPLPIVSWLVPFIGHIGICREDGVILDFAGPNFVSVDNFAFGAVARYIQLNREQCFFPLSSSHACQDRHKNGECGTEMTLDDALRMSTQEFQHRSYNLFTCNCHSYVANSLNRVCYGGHNRWNVVNLAIMIFFKAQWVNKVAILRSFLPFVLVLSLGLLFVGWPFLIALAAFCFSLVGWFLFGTYCVKNLIHL